MAALYACADLCKHDEAEFYPVLAPAMALTLLSDCIADRGRTFGKQVLFGIPVLFSLGVVIYETMVLFTGERSGSSIVFAIAPGLLAWNRHPVAALLQSAGFSACHIFGKSAKAEKRPQLPFRLADMAYRPAGISLPF